ncbi:MAG TPA: hypothetical protein VM533_04050, partial [Fimbriiglobus sp.]|nr:hypothetical protein [Fimbriiglobus sp.]
MVTPIRPTAEELLARAAELRAEGSSWVVVARELGTTPEQARRMTEEAGADYRRLRARAGRAVLDDAFAEALFFARLDLRGDDDKLRQRAYDIIFRAGDNRSRRRTGATAKPREIKLEDLPEDWQYRINLVNYAENMSAQERERVYRVVRNNYPWSDRDEPPDGAAGEPARPTPP